MSHVKKLILLFLLTTQMSWADGPHNLPIGMNVGGNNYWVTQTAFRDVMKTASEWISYEGDTWDTKVADKIPIDSQGYPLELPYSVGDKKNQLVRFLVNNCYKGRYILEYEGEGKLDIHIPNITKDGKIILILDGSGEHRWINITKSVKGNHIRNIHILPEESVGDVSTTFHPVFLEGLKPFHCLRFMDWMNINGSPQTTWNTRSKPDYYSQGLSNGVAIEYSVELCNILKCDAWFCIPHKADDDYIRHFAELVRDTLDPALKIYVEYSNEIWNWGFGQSSYVLENAPGAIDKYVTEALKKISPSREDHPEKDAYMMQRTFKIWSEVFQEEKDRIVRVAAVQAGWADNTKRILEFLFKKDINGKVSNNSKLSVSTGEGCDAISPAGYFYWLEKDVNRWKTMSPSDVSASMILDSADKEIKQQDLTKKNGNVAYANAWNVDFVVYEGGQHMVPFKEKDKDYSEPVWKAQIDPKMYDVYMNLLNEHAKPDVKCKLFCAYNYVGSRKESYGSWGHIENLNQLNNMDEIRKVAPKFAAILDANSARE